MKTVRAELVKTWEPKFCPCPCRGQLRRMLVSRLDLPVSWTGVIQIARQVRVAAFQSDGNRKRGCTPPAPRRHLKRVAFANPGWVWLKDMRPFQRNSPGIQAGLADIVHIPAAIGNLPESLTNRRAKLTRARAEIRQRREVLFYLSPPEAECDTRSSLRRNGSNSARP